MKFINWEWKGNFKAHLLWIWVQPEKSLKRVSLYNS